MKTVRINKNIYGNYACFVGTKKETDFGELWAALEWAAKLVDQGGYTMSDKSDVSPYAVKQFINDWM